MICIIMLLDMLPVSFLIRVCLILPPQKSALSWKFYSSIIRQLFHNCPGSWDFQDSSSVEWFPPDCHGDCSCPSSLIGLRFTWWSKFATTICAYPFCAALEWGFPHMVVERWYHHESLSPLYGSESKITSHGSRHKRPPCATNPSRASYNEDYITRW